jgi:rare lipoprotein A
MKPLLLLKIILLCFLSQSSFSQHNHHNKNYSVNKKYKKTIVKYGIASFYADKFHVRQTANGEKYNRMKYTAACNVFPLNSWIKVTNLSNHRSVILKINDRLSKKNKRLVDVSKSAAQKLGFISRGITKVKVELLKR